MDPVHLLRYVIAPTLEHMAAHEPRMDNPASRALVLGTGLHESALKYLQQLGDGPAMGLYQMEPFTHDDLWLSYLRNRPDIERLFRGLVPGHLQIPPPATLLRTDLGYATAMCRLRYWVRPEALPPFEPAALARYHEVHYNTRLGAIGATLEVLEALKVFKLACEIVASDG